jgi:hypothetical protein
MRLDYHLIAGTRGLKLMILSVPHTADIFDPVTLGCEYDLEGRKLYSVKWYKDENEFFRYMPYYEPQIQAFHTPGITLDVSSHGLFFSCIPGCE